MCRRLADTRLRAYHSASLGKRPDVHPRGDRHVPVRGCDARATLRFTPEQPLHIFAFLANIGIGLPYVIAQRMGFGAGLLSSPTYDYGNTYLWVAGLLNYLIVLDGFDIAQGRKP